MGILIDAVGQALNHWPLLFVILGGQLAHELTHFAVARRLGAEPIIRIRLRSPMTVVYDRRGLSTTEEAYIGLAPTATGLAAACAWLIVYGWPAVTPTAVAAGVAWMLYTVPSRDDMAAAGQLIAPDGGWGEPRRSVFIGLAVIGVAAWLPALPYSVTYTQPAAMGVAVGAMAYIALAFIEHGMPDSGSLAD